MPDRLQELLAFVRTAESGSFSRAARELGLSQPSVSRIVGELEARLGVRLLLRTTRRVTATDAGHAFLEGAKRTLAELEAAEDAARGVDSLRGVIRMATPVSFGAREVVPRLAPFLRRHPALRAELLMSDARADLVAEGVDVALRVGDLESSGFGSRRLTSTPRLIVAAPGYLAERGAPAAAAELAGHDWVFGPGPSGRRTLELRRGAAAASVQVEPRVLCTSAEGELAALRAGLGLGVITLWLAREALRAGELVPVLTRDVLAPLTAHAVFPGGPRPSAKVLALVDHLVDAFAN